jgi:CRP/FNR family transcriptional regulator, anaerobic regulatory protein
LLFYFFKVFLPKAEGAAAPIFFAQRPMTELEKYIQSYFGLEKEELKIISNFFEPRTLKKGEFFLKSGRHCDRLAFVEKGLIREFVDINNREITKWIATEGYFVVDLAGFMFGLPARYNMQALSDCEMHVIELKRYREIAQVLPRWAELEKLFIARCFAVIEDRVLQHLALSAEERYHKLFEFNKALFNQVPLQYLASMLGMTPETFSRIRKKAADSIS